MRHTFCFFVLPGMVGLLLSPAHAAFNPKHVGADAKWVVFLDLNELRESALGKEAIASVQKQMPAELAQADVRVNWDRLLTTIGAITAYGANFAPDPKMLDGTLIAHGTPDLRKIAEALVLQATITTPKNVSELTGLPFEAYSLGGELIIGFPKEPIVIISKSKAQLLKAHDVFRGAIPSLAANPSSPLRGLIDSAERAYVVAASVMPTDNKAFTQDGPQARIVQLLDSGAISIGENGPRTEAHLKLNASSDDNAVKLAKIVEGMTAMLSLAETSDRNLSEFMRSATVRRKDRTVTVDLAYATDRLTQMINSLQQVHQPSSRRSPAQPRPIPGKAIAEWKLDGAADGTATPAERLTTRQIDNVRLVNSAVVTVGARSEGGHGRALIDVVEVVPMDGGAPLRFEAENMNVQHGGGSAYRPLNASYASGRRVLALTSGSFGLATFVFPGADGNYSIRLHYVDEADARSSLTVTVRDPVIPPIPK